MATDVRAGAADGSDDDARKGFVLVVPHVEE